MLAKEVGHRAVAVNSILPTAIEGAGVFTDGVRSEVPELGKSFRPMQRMGTEEDVAEAAEYLAGFVSCQHPMVSGGTGVIKSLRPKYEPALRLNRREVVAGGRMGVGRSTASDRCVGANSIPIIERRI
ncbi:hypothetical protein FHS21_004575 [Phyllobacterium trifolii]|uniref:Uncharacterized protein n=1 Tax=Phyllobacterium trifolii TaxID=300193 RepID=A0A839UH60_9HYPH|nr:hypothetical protein [Phyllobacterium trifolii]MBB3148132.1 hypothetical protein [Phyllobacterium trifolii]